MSEQVYLFPELNVTQDDIDRANRLPDFGENLRRPSPAGALLGQHLRDQGHAFTLENADDDFSAQLWNVWYGVCQRLREVTSDELWDSMSPDLFAYFKVHYNCVGALVRASAKKGWVENTQRGILTARAIGQGREITVWKSLLYGRA